MSVLERYYYYFEVTFSLLGKYFPLWFSHIVEKYNTNPFHHQNGVGERTACVETSIPLMWNDPSILLKPPIVVSRLENRYYFIWVYLIKRFIVSWLQYCNYFNECNDICHCTHKQHKLFLIILLNKTGFFYGGWGKSSSYSLLRSNNKICTTLSLKFWPRSILFVCIGRSLFYREVIKKKTTLCVVRLNVEILYRLFAHLSIRSFT